MVYIRALQFSYSGGLSAGTLLKGAVELDSAGVVYVADRSMVSGENCTTSEAHTKTLIHLFISDLSSHVYGLLSSLLQKTDKRKDCFILEANFNFGSFCQTATASRFDFDHKIVPAKDRLLVFRLENRMEGD